MITLFTALMWLLTVGLAFYLGVRVATRQIAKGLVNAYKQFLSENAKYSNSDTPIGDRLADECNWDIEF
jgi:hypothetical protein